MGEKIYIRGWRDGDHGDIKMPLVSSAVLFVTRYCQADHFNVYLVKTSEEEENDNVITVNSAIIKDLRYEFIKENDVPCLVKNCILPVTVDERTSIIRCGLCGTVRHIVQSSHTKNPGENFKDLLGFRQGSLRMCAEVSGWTKLCEIELPSSIYQLITLIRNRVIDDKEEVEIPVNLMKLEMHFEKPPKIHNDHKLKKALLVKNREQILNPESGTEFLENGCKKGSQFLIECDITLPHGLQRYRVFKNVNNTLYLKSDRDYRREKAKKEKVPRNPDRPITKPRTRTDEEKAAQKRAKKKRRKDRETAKYLEEISLEREKINANSNNLEKEFQELSVNGSSDIQQELLEPHANEEIRNCFKTISTLDVEFIHLYSEGLEITVADLILFVYCYFLMQSLEFSMGSLGQYLPHIESWFDHMMTLPRLQEAAKSCGFNSNKILDSLPTITNDIQFIKPCLPVTLEDEMELNRRNKTSVRAIKPELTEALNLIQNGCIDVILGEHPRQEQVEIDWSSLPTSAHPQDGEVPKKRIERKCQQLENLVTAVVEIAKDGDVIVDFCSGGGHLGIVIAYLLPKCTIYLIENKEESIERARSRLDNLKLTNVVIYQCNLGYFHGHFSIGVCLHACGVATDMVLQQCLDNNAAFVICPCCYGNIVRTHQINYPRSSKFRNAGLSYKDSLTLGHAADQTEFNIALAGQGCYCANLVDTDRAELAREQNYTVSLCSLKPLSCTPKNNLLIGTPN
ncbi:hypothetical protein SNE40_016526 [Patella caerulea]|uniref:Methyltransferase domain-containing protein n=1 Tax=Patella caerulea TaxID=87958 RepID=A0AAN8J8S1_PATCE